ncbi:alpha-ketoglutarate-dependent dioxygenase AlkB family protein [Winogradskyella aurantia]|uniref:Alpha-ketoglutarate-dependent dioxygenase AlkB n=1 Tax=Winogradskyella aurantia TaxID=1915063 RepID=A0A265UQC6_9FLAO|nr:alpha-ketoglutarate-dependent dioxygenase AlkB [Winogradskyella aurantia]OZV67503.1 alpha-ketoglutarate-dependent dioxygenase AlkB [Winogradskyella aurantia]
MDLLKEGKQHLKLPNAEIEYYPNFLSEVKANRYFEIISDETNWQQDNIKVFGKTYKQPRLTGLYGETNQPYSYSNIIMYPRPFTKTIMTIKRDIEAISNEKFNTVLINLYRDGNDSNGWHGDNEKELGMNPVIASLSLGEVRPFHFKHRKLKEERYKINLQHGSLLLMKGEMQHHWLHQIAKTKKKIDPRINLTFRRLLN